MSSTLCIDAEKSALQSLATNLRGNYFIEVDVVVILGRVYATLKAEVSNNRAGDGRVCRDVSRMSCSVGQWSQPGLEADDDENVDWAELIDHLWPRAGLPHASSGKSAPYCQRRHNLRTKVGRWQQQLQFALAQAITIHTSGSSSSSSTWLTDSSPSQRRWGLI